MSALSERPVGAVARHYDRLDRFYRQIWGEHLHHGLWRDPSWSVEEAVRHLVHEVAADGQFEEGTRVCDVGCGYGAPARVWSDVYGADVIGFTVSPTQHACAEQRRGSESGPEYRLQDFFENEMAAESVEAVVAIESLTHIDDPARVFREAARLLRPGGRLVCCVWMAARDVSQLSRSLLLKPICAEGRLSGLPTAMELRRWATRAGFCLQQLTDRTADVRRTWRAVLGRLWKALWTDPAVMRTLLDASIPDRVFARTVIRIAVAQHLGVLRYGWLVAER